MVWLSLPPSPPPQLELIQQVCRVRPSLRWNYPSGPPRYRVPWPAVACVNQLDSVVHFHHSEVQKQARWPKLPLCEPLCLAQDYLAEANWPVLPLEEVRFVVALYLKNQTGQLAKLDPGNVS